MTTLSDAVAELAGALPTNPDNHDHVTVPADLVRQIVEALTPPDIMDVVAGRHPSTQAVARYFPYGHLPEGPLRDTSRRCHDLAVGMILALPDGPELTTGLRKQLEGKDCFVRAALDMEG